VTATPARAVRAIGAHGQTVRHRPEQGYTLQLIDGARLAERAGIPVVCDFRSADVAAGGQGAPLVPAFHASVFAHPGRRRVIANIGGIANVSLLAQHEPVRGFDTGPGNLLLDLWCARHTGAAFDRDGAWGARGQVQPALLERLLLEPYFRQPAPKSTGRDLFHAAWLEQGLAGLGALRPEDVQATLVELTAATLAGACRDFGADEVFVCGGGARNRALMARLSEHCAPARVDTTDALGAGSQAVEAVAFAWLAARRMRGLPGNLPEVTGARGARVLGALYPAPPRPDARPHQGPE
jgi:anhydro-N-acetylmuramic acid kinase